MNVDHHFGGLRARRGYDEQNALSLAVACQLAYASRSVVRDTVRRWGWTTLDVVSKKKGRDIDTQCFLMEHDRDLVVAFRGSDSGADWFANFQASQDPGPFRSTGAHEGFQDALYPAVIALTQHVRRAGASDQRVWITGHSLGGALASLYAGMLLENRLDVYGLYTFASPRPGSPRFADQLNDRIRGPHYRVVNDGDVVPHVPPEPFFSHPGKRIILKRRRKERTKSSWWSQRVDALKHFVKTTGDKFDIADNHRLAADDESYIPRLARDLVRANR